MLLQHELLLYRQFEPTDCWGCFGENLIVCNWCLHEVLRCLLGALWAEYWWLCQFSISLRSGRRRCFWWVVLWWRFKQSMLCRCSSRWRNPFWSYHLSILSFAVDFVKKVLEMGLWAVPKMLLIFSAHIDGDIVKLIRVLACLRNFKLLLSQLSH